MSVLRCGWCLSSDMWIDQRDRKLPTTKLFICNNCQHRNTPEELTDQIPLHPSRWSQQESIV